MCSLPVVWSIFPERMLSCNAYEEMKDFASGSVVKKAVFVGLKWVWNYLIQLWFDSFT